MFRQKLSAMNFRYKAYTLMMTSLAHCDVNRRSWLYRLRSSVVNNICLSTQTVTIFQNWRTLMEKLRLISTYIVDVVILHNISVLKIRTDSLKIFACDKIHTFVTGTVQFMC